MLEFLSYAGIAVAVLVAGVLLYASSKPGSFSYARSITIAAPPAAIFPHINDLHAFNAWNPFLKKDAATRLDYSGPPGGIGAAHAWEGNSNVGKGRAVITESAPSSRIVMQLDMIKPMAATNRVEFTLVPVAGATTVTWAMDGRQPLMAKLMTVFIDCDRMVGGEFEKGLAELKLIVEG